VQIDPRSGLNPFSAEQPWRTAVARQVVVFAPLGYCVMARVPAFGWSVWCCCC